MDSGIPEDLCSVEYPDFMEAIVMCMEAGGEACYIAKSDMSMAFRNIPLNKRSWCYLVLKASHPVTGRTYYFVDKCLPFGASISCAIFQEFSNSIAFLVTYVTNSYFILWEFSTSQKELLLVSSRSISSLISGGDSGESWVLVHALGLL